MVNFSLFEPSQMTTEGCLPQGMSPVAHFADMPVRPRGTEVLVCGFESTHTGARFAGYDALFQILASAPGWDE
jgi:hypothetical protein